MDDAIVDTFTTGARLVGDAVSEPLVQAAWTRPSVLAGQTVGSLAGHLARGGVWVVADYLAASPDDGPVDVDSAAEYFHRTTVLASVADHRAIRERGAAVAAAGAAAVAGHVLASLAGLDEALRAASPSRVIRVAGGLGIRLDEYLKTRIVEQAVHLDDLARSLPRDPWPYPSVGTSIAIDVAWQLARRTVDPPVLLRALYRDGFAETAFPVL